MIRAEEIIFNDNSFKVSDNRKSLKNKKKASPKMDNVKGKDKKGELKEKGKKENGSISKEEVGFLSYLVKSYSKVKTKDKLKKGEVEEKKKDIKKNRGKPGVEKRFKEANIKGDLKGKEEGAKQVFNNKKIEPEKIFSELYKEKEAQKIEGIKNFETFKKTVNSKSEKRKAPQVKKESELNEAIKLNENEEKSIKFKKILKEKRVETSKIEEIKVNHTTKEIKFEPLRNERIEKPAQKESISKANPIEAIAKMIQIKKPEGTRIFRLHLEPPELGKVYIQLTFTKDKKVEMKIYVEKGEVKDYFVHNISNLKGELKSMGFEFEKPQIYTMGEFTAGDNESFNGSGERERERRGRGETISGSPFEEKEVQEEYVVVMENLREKINIMV